MLRIPLKQLKATQISPAALFAPVGKGGENMTISSLRCQYPGKVCVCRVHLRDLKSRRVVSWVCLEAVDTVDAARGVLERLDREGVTDTVAISTSESITIEGTLAARYFRVYLGLG